MPCGGYGAYPGLCAQHPRGAAGVSASRTLTVVAEATNRDSVYASADSHSRCDLQPGESLTITTAVEQLGLITFDETEQFRAIETKLMRR